MGRIGRMQFIKQLLLSLVSTVAIVFLAVWADPERREGAGIAGFLIFLAIAARTASTRLHDLGWSGWWLVTLVPVPLLFILRGTRGPNRYGPDPLDSVL